MEKTNLKTRWVISVFLLVAAVGSLSAQAAQTGEIVAWGYNSEGQLNAPAPNSGFIAIAAGGYHSLGLKDDGSVAAWGWNYWGQCNVPAPNSGFIAIAAGSAHNLGLKEDGSVAAWGYSGHGVLNVPAPNSGFIAIAAGSWHSLGLKEDGSVAAWGNNTYGQLNIPAPNSGFIAIAAGDHHSLALKEDGSVAAWGYNGFGQLYVPAPNSSFVAIAGGSFHSLGLKDDGSVVAWGSNNRGQCNVPAPNSGFIAIAAGHLHSLGLKEDGSVAAWGYNSEGQCNVGAPNSGFIDVAAGGYHSLALVQEVTEPEVYYVDGSNGDDNNDGLTEATAFGTIQKGIDKAWHGDTIIVLPGRYYENINFRGKRLTLRSSDPNHPEETIIDGGGLDSVVRFNGTETSDCKLLGFTLTNGYGPGDEDGGGITGASSNATIANCIIKDNVAQKHGGGIRDFNGLIDRCKIFGNSTDNRHGGGLTGCHGTISNCLIYENTATLSGGAMAVCNGDIVNCTIVDNTAGVSGGGIFLCGGTITNCIIWDNNFEQVLDSSAPTYSCIQDWEGGGAGNISTEPEFVDPNNGDYHLLAGSPCINAGDPNYAASPDTIDIDGNLRIINGIVDIGAYEFFNTPPVANAGEDQVVYAWIDGIAEVQLDGSDSNDVDGDELTYLWTWMIDANEMTATGVDPNVELPVGVHEIELVVNDGTQDSGSDEVVITVIEPVEADVHIVPRVINRRSRMKRVIAIMRLPEGISKGDVADEPFVLYVDDLDDVIEAVWQRVIGWRRRARVFALFDKDELLDIVPGLGGKELTVIGKLESGQYIYGSDTVRIVQPRRRRQGRLRRR